MRLACEIGGTFTHRVVEDDDRIKGMGVIPAATRAIMSRPCRPGAYLRLRRHMPALPT
jgi:hypothetical protein